VEGDKVIFNVPHSGVNGLLGFRVDDEAGQVLWDVRLAYEEGHRFTYGVLPTGGNMPAKQKYPDSDRPPVDIRGKTVIVSIQYQYDSPAPSAGTFKKTVRIP
jgi:hypothetical protein